LRFWYYEKGWTAVRSRQFSRLSPSGWRLC
jgi:hypothetical protein